MEHLLRSGSTGTKLSAAAELASIGAVERPVADEAELRKLARASVRPNRALPIGWRHPQCGLLPWRAPSSGEREAPCQLRLLSTVLAGNIGAWLQRIIYERGSPEAAQEALSQNDKPPPELVVLRNYTSYLAPQGGLFSTDTWTDIVLTCVTCC